MLDGEAINEQGIETRFSFEDLHKVGQLLQVDARLLDSVVLVQSDNLLVCPPIFGRVFLARGRGVVGLLDTRHNSLW